MRGVKAACHLETLAETADHLLFGSLTPPSHPSASSSLPIDLGADPSKRLFTLTKAVALRAALAWKTVAAAARRRGTGSLRGNPCHQTVAASLNRMTSGGAASSRE